MKKILLSLFTVFYTLSMMAQDCSNLFISEYIEGSGNNKAIELYNPTGNPIDLSDYVLVRYRNGLFTPNVVNLAGTIEPKGTFVFVLDKRDPLGTGNEIMVDSALQVKADAFLCPVYEVSSTMYFNGNDAVTLEKTNGDIVDIFAHIGPPMLEEDEGWGDITDTTIIYNDNEIPTEYTIHDYIVGPLFWLSWTSNHSLIRKPGVTHGITANPDVFVVTQEWDSLPENMFDSLRFHKCDCDHFGISDNKTPANVSIYPNPADNGQIRITADQFIGEVQIIDMLGKTVAAFINPGRSKTFDCHLGESLHGLYFIRLSFTEGTLYSSKVIFR